MVSIRAKGIRRARAMEAIEDTLGIKLQTPRTRDNDLRHIMELEQVADAVAGITAQASSRIEELEEQLGGVETDPRLEKALEYVESGNWTKSEMEAALNGDTDSDTAE